MRIALVQMNITHGQPKENYERVEKLIEKALKKDPDTIILPEMWNTSYALKDLAQIADREGKPHVGKIKELAKKYEVNIIAGSIADKRNDKIYNTSYILDRKGQEIAQYNKIHLFGLMNENRYLSAGNKRITFELDGIKCGLIICYDVRFPELARSLALERVKILFIPAQWPHPRLHPWRTLIQARAIENQFFVVAVNRVGQEGKAKFFGHSMVVDPQGKILQEGSEEEEIIFTDIDLGEVDKVRAYMTCFQDRMPEAYR